MNWRTTIGGALSNFGKALMGAGLLLQSSDSVPASKAILWYVALAGLILSCSAGLFTSLFSADSKVLKQVSDQTNSNTNDIAAVKSETSFTTKP